MRLIEPRALLRAVILPALASAAAAVDEPRLQDPRAALLLTAIAIQESDLRWEKQHPTGPARSWWQIEPMTGGRAMYRATVRLGARWCDLLADHGLAGPLGQALEDDPTAACIAARLLLWHDPLRLPDLGDEPGGWACYERVWRPGKPRPQHWPRAYVEAMDAMQEPAVA